MCLYIHVHKHTHGWKTYRMENFIYINDKYNLKNTFIYMYILYFEIAKKKKKYFKYLPHMANLI